MENIYTVMMKKGIHVPAEEDCTYLLIDESEYKVLLGILKNMELRDELKEVMEEYKNE